MKNLKRRDFLQIAATTSGAITLTSAWPQAFARAAEASKNEDRILVCVQLSGGNDGLNTVVPYADDAYNQARKKLRISEEDVLKIDDHFGFHPRLEGFADLFEAGELCIAQGIGYPEPNRSHFESMDIWHTCQRKTETRQSGWLGRSIDQMTAAAPISIPAVHLGHQKQPIALASINHAVPSIQSLDRFRWELSQSSNGMSVNELLKSQSMESDSLLGFVESNTATAIDVSSQLQAAAAKSKNEQPYPDWALAKKLETVSQLISSGLQTRIYYVELDGFDTHAFQPPSHAALLQELSESVAAFQKDLEARGEAERVVTLCFSEFGRRVEENASEGTDHGTAAPLFLVGKQVQGGFVGEHPSLTDLDQGDLKFHTDFRQAYAAILENWLECESESILGGKYEPISLIHKPVV